MPLRNLPAPERPPDITLWAQGYGIYGRLDDGPSDVVKHRLGGFIGGVDMRFADTWQVGMGAGYARTHAHLVGLPSASDVDTFDVAAYTGLTLGSLTLRSGASYAWHAIASERSVEFGNSVDRPTARYDGGTGQAFAEAAYTVALGRVVAEPFAGITYVSIRTDGFSELGGIAALTATGTRQDLGFTSLGLRLATTLAMSDALKLTPRLSAAWQHAFGDLNTTQQLSFRDTATTFSVPGIPIDRESLLLEAGFDAVVGAHAVIGLCYIGALSRTAQDHGVKGVFTWTF